MSVQMIPGTLSLGPTYEGADSVNSNELRDPENPNMVTNSKSEYHGENQKFGSESRNARDFPQLTSLHLPETVDS